MRLRFNIETNNDFFDLEHWYDLPVIPRIGEEVFMDELLYGSESQKARELLIKGVEGSGEIDRIYLGKDENGFYYTVNIKIRY